LPLNGRITARFIVTTALLPVLDIPEVELFPDDIRRDDDTPSTVCTAMKTNMNTARCGTRLPPQVIADFTFGQYMYSANNNMSILYFYNNVRALSRTYYEHIMLDSRM